MGAWIETGSGWLPLRRWRVAPHVGAWIETLLNRVKYAYYLSHPMWVRGLKQNEDKEKIMAR